MARTAGVYLLSVGLGGQPELALMSQFQLYVKLVRFFSSHLTFHYPNSFPFLFLWRDGVPGHRGSG